MSTDHELMAAQLHEEMINSPKDHRDMSGAPLPARGLEEKAAYNKQSLDANALESKTSPDEFEKGDYYESPDGEVPTAYEIKTLRHVGEWLPLRIWLIAIVELCERFTYYGMSGLFQNYISHPSDGSIGRAGLGQGHTAATGLTTFFQFWCYVTPIGGAIIADEYLGRYKTILLFAIIYFCGLLILTITSIPSIIFHNDAGFAGLIVAILVIGVGTGGIKSNVAPLIADQYERRAMAVKTEKNGERTIIDPAITIQRIYMIFYACINIGSLSLIATPYMELYINFWPAYLMCLCMFAVGIIVLIIAKPLVIVRPPKKGVITNSFRCVWMMIKARNTNGPKPSYIAAHGGNTTVPWDDVYVDQIKRALSACKIFCFYPIYWLCYGQFSNNFVSQAEQMDGHGIPNDFMQNFDPISIIVFIPILDRIVYPALRKAHIEIKPIARISLGFILVSLSMTYAAILQHYIYLAPPCFDAPLTCAFTADGTAIPNNIHIAIQTPAYIFVGISEIFASVTGLEYAYTKAPLDLKSFVSSLYLLTNAFGSALAEAFISLVNDPTIMYMYTGFAVAAFVTGFIVYGLFRHYDTREDEMNQLEVTAMKDEQAAMGQSAPGHHLAGTTGSDEEGHARL